MEHSAIIGAVLGALTAFALVACWRRWAAHQRSRLARQRGRHAVRGEHTAEKLLLRRGYTILERQATRSWLVRVAGHCHEIVVRADLLVMRDGRRLVAEVKTGDIAPHITNASTRRQLLEYLLAYRADGLLLIQPDRGTVSTVEFPLAAPGAAD